MTPQPPPIPDNDDGQTRRVGVEIEFAGLPPKETAHLVQTLFGGDLEAISAHRLKVRNTRWGDFGIELDTQYAHPDHQRLDTEAYRDSEWERMRQDFHARTRELIGDVVTGLVPTEIVCPPVPWNELDDLDTLFDALRRHGAKAPTPACSMVSACISIPRLPAWKSTTSWLACGPICSRHAGYANRFTSISPGRSCHTPTPSRGPTHSRCWTRTTSRTCGR